MTVYTQATNLVAAGVQYSLTGGDSLLVYQGVTLGSTTSNAIQVVGATSTAFIAGTLFSGSADGVATVVEGTLNIAATGAVTGNESLGNGALLINTGGTVVNDGSITSSGGYGILLFGLGSTATNAGRITGGSGGVFMGVFDSDAQTLTNTGSIIAGVRSVPNARFGHGVQVEGDGIEIFNAGTIIANGTGRSGIHLGGYDPVEFASGLRITNDGVIRSVRGWGVDGIDNLTSGFTLINSGTISGGIGAIRGTAGADVVTNAGVIAGNVILGLGNDRFRGGAADQAQTVYGGAGTDSVVGGMFDDQFYGGSEADTLLGGAGEDGLYGGSGDDDLFGGAGDDTMLGGTGNDDYRIITLSDVVSEGVGAANGTADRVISSTISLNLNLYRNVEGAALTGIAALNLTGTAGANTLTGNAAANILSGGAGRDTLTGGDGRDTFVFLTAADTGGVSGTGDRITDFTHGTDRIDLRAVLNGGSFQGAALNGAIGVAYDPVTHTILGSTDTTFLPEFRIVLQAGAVVTGADFIF